MKIHFHGLCFFLVLLAQVDLGTIKDDFFFSTERKRILNEKWEPDFNDNVKQDKSIDVYNREADELANA